MPVGGGGGTGGAAATTSAVTKIDSIDPHIVMMMRDVMDSATTAIPLKVSAGAAGGRLS